MIFKADGGQGDLNGFLDEGSHLDGELRFEDTFRVDGRLSGKVVSEGDLVVGDRGQVSGEIAVGRLFVSGEVRGMVHAARRIEVSVGGRLLADVSTPALVLEEGAIFEGQCSMSRREGERRQGVLARMPLPTDG